MSAVCYTAAHLNHHAGTRTVSPKIVKIFSYSLSLLFKRKRQGVQR